MPTYTPLQSIVLTSATASVVFSNINQNYQDLILIQNTSTSSSGNIYLRYNEDSTSSYSNTVLNATSASINSGRNSATTKGFIDSDAYAQNNFKYNAVTHIMNYSNTTTFKTALTKASNTGIGFTANVMTYIKTSAISRIEVFANVGNLQAGSTFDLYAISPAAANTAQASGGTDIYYDSSYVYHVFKGSGTFTPTRALTANILVVAGGGGASAGGGGAGGLLEHTSQSLTAGSSYAVTVGAGGAGNGSDNNAFQGSNSQFGSLTASTGGGLGAGGAVGQVTGGNGGSGGGAGAAQGSTTVTASGGTGSQGSNGGGVSGTSRAGGGGGGYSTAGSAAGSGNGVGGVGGDGTNSYSTWASATSSGVSGYFAGGGGGTSTGSTTKAGGAGGGGTGGGDSVEATAGNTNTGSGGGGSRTASAGRAGGSGIVIVRYAR